ncbi:MAG: hypothetical protein HZA22_00305 [Nitrospirae bacterium]|nr:hypothetical protein [Nitrospirota bacterium]MBI5694398.1 hypothetical protein [Nitrospirota bacterium]
MDSLTITINLDTSAARREVEEFRAYAMGVIAEVRAAYSSLGPALQPGASASGDGQPLPGETGIPPRRY